MKEKVDSSQYRKVQQDFEKYRIAQGDSVQTAATSKSDAFYLLRHDDTIDFWELLFSEDFEERAYEHLKNVLLAKSSAKANNINSYMKCIRQLREFLQADKVDIIKKPPTSQPSKADLHIPRPSCVEVDKYLHRWNTTPDLYEPEAVLRELFTEVYPHNRTIDEIILKAAALNSIYNTRITSIYPISSRILSLDIDERLRAGDETLVNEIMGVDYKSDGETDHTDHYSFATKFCSFHNPDAFPIYDSYVDAILWYYHKTEHFSDFHRKRLKDYPTFKRVINDFRRYFGLEQYTVKELDQFLWQYGKDFF